MPGKMRTPLMGLTLIEPMEGQGPVDMIVHKMTDVVSKMNQGDIAAKEQYDRFMSYCRDHPQVILLDRWEHIEKVFDRAVMFDYLRPCIKGQDPLFKIPDSITLDSVHLINQALGRLSFPIMCKRRSACSSTEAHQMTILPSQTYLDSTQKWTKHYGDTEPLVLQRFIQHDGVIVKIYVADGQINVSTRPSFINVTPQTGVIHFDSQMLPKQFEKTVPTSSCPQDVHNVVMSSDTRNVQTQKEALLDHIRLQQIATLLQDHLGLTFFGFDVLMESGTNDYYVVDVNYFPSFKNVPHFQSTFVSILKKNLTSSSIDQCTDIDQN
ncbi:hypothetical protein [Absidia glauca]|uniref:Inositol-tetrakisphosphate 1-kinase n=1 Tax=Absidia glauca TaxID=4829 RepID=A0A168PMW4_ABSGL|nr:hypothetical protein [Absidia glauca]